MPYFANCLRKFGTNGRLNVLKGKKVLSLSRINLRRSVSLHIIQAAFTDLQMSVTCNDDRMVCEK